MVPPLRPRWSSGKANPFTKGTNNMADDLEAQRQTAAYSRHIAWLRHTAPDLTDEEMDAQALQKVNESVYGADAKKDRKGAFIPQGIGSPGKETANHFAAILKYEGKEAWD